MHTRTKNTHTYIHIRTHKYTGLGMFSVLVGVALVMVPLELVASGELIVVVCMYACMYACMYVCMYVYNGAA